MIMNNMRLNAYFKRKDNRLKLSKDGCVMYFNEDYDESEHYIQFIVLNNISNLILQCNKDNDIFKLIDHLLQNNTFCDSYGLYISKNVLTGFNFEISCSYDENYLYLKSNIEFDGSSLVGGYSTMTITTKYDIDSIKAITSGLKLTGYELAKEIYKEFEYNDAYEPTVD